VKKILEIGRRNRDVFEPLPGEPLNQRFEFAVVTARPGSTARDSTTSPSGSLSSSIVSSRQRILTSRLESSRKVRLSRGCFSTFFFPGSSLQNLVRGLTAGAGLLAIKKPG
jgi:hypothetical protein